MADANLQVVISAVDRASRNIGNVNRSVQGMSRQMQSANRRVSAFTGQMRTMVGVLAGAGVGVAVAASFRAATRAAADFEQGLISVSKTTGIEGQALQRLGQNLRQMSTEIPVATSELTDLGTVAGQLGVRGTSNITKFIDTIARLGFASNVQGEEAAQALARILNVTGEGIDNVDRLASTIVQLGNNFATSEREITRMTNEIARTTASFGTSSAEAAGFAAALSSVGVRSELAGSTMGRLFATASQAISQGGKELQAFADIAGVTSEQFASSFREDTTGTIRELLQGMARLNEQGVTQLTAGLESIGLSGAEVQKVIPPIAGNIDELSRSFEMANTEFRRNQALIKESERAFESFNSQATIVKNSFTAIAAEVGEGFLDELANSLEGIGNTLRSPALLGTATAIGEAIGNIVTQVNAWFAANQQTLGFMANALRAILGSMGTLVSLVGQMLSPLVSARSEISILEGIVGTISIFVAGLVDGFRLIAAVAVKIGTQLQQFVLSRLQTMLDLLASAVAVVNKDLADSLRNATASMQQGSEAAEEWADGVFEAFRNGNTELQKTRDLLDGTKTDMEEAAHVAENYVDIVSGIRGGGPSRRGRGARTSESADDDGDETETPTPEDTIDIEAQLREVKNRTRQALNEGLSLQESRERIEREFSDLMTALQERGRTADIRLLDRMINAEAFQQQADQILDRVRDIRDQFRDEAANIEARAATGDLNEAGAQQQIQAARKRTIEQLRTQRRELERLQAQAGDDRFAQQIQRIDTQIRNLGQTTGGVMQSVGRTLEDSLGNALAKVGTEITTLEGFIRNMARNAVQQLQKIAAQKIAVQAIGSFGFSGGGQAQSFAGGGPVRGPGSATSDSIPARLSDGEYVLRTQAVQHYGAQFVEALNRMRVPKSSLDRYGGLSVSTGRRMGFAEGGMATEAAQGQEGGRGNLRIVNSVDPRITKDFLASGEGERTILNIIDRNRERVSKSVK